jgi:hypothetical protein
MEGIIVILWVLCGWACSSIAKSKNRNKELWSVLGVLFGIIALAVIFLLPQLPG